MDRGILTVEMSLVMALVLVFLGLLLVEFGHGFELIAKQTFEAPRYQEAFNEKVKEIRHEKVLKEKR